MLFRNVFTAQVATCTDATKLVEQVASCSISLSNTGFLWLSADSNAFMGPILPVITCNRVVQNSYLLKLSLFFARKSKLHLQVENISMKLFVSPLVCYNFCLVIYCLTQPLPAIIYTMWLTELSVSRGNDKPQSPLDIIATDTGFMFTLMLYTAYAAFSMFTLRAVSNPSGCPVSTADSIFLFRVFIVFIKSEDVFQFRLGGISANEHYGFSYAHSTRYAYLQLGLLKSNTVSCSANIENRKVRSSTKSVLP